MAHLYPTGLGTVFRLQQGGINTPLLPKDLNAFLLNQNPRIDLANPHTIDLSLLRKEDHLLTNRRLLECNKLMMIDSSTRNSLLANVQDAQLEMLLFGFQVAKQCNRQESILKLLASSSNGKESNFRDLLFDLGSQQSSASHTTRWRFTDTESEWMSLAYPNTELYFNEHSPETCNCMGSLFLHPDCQQIQNCFESEGHNVNALLSAMPELHIPKTPTNKSSKLAMLVPYFDRRRSKRPKKDVTVTPNIKAAQQTEKANKQARKEEKKSIRINDDTENYPDTYLNACDCLLSIIVHRKHPEKRAIHSLKNSGSQLLIDIITGIAGAGVAVLLTVVYGVLGRGMPICYPRILSAGFGLGLVWLSSAIYELRGILMSICRSSGDAGGPLEKPLRLHLDRNVKDIRFRVAALMAIAFIAIGFI